MGVKCKSYIKYCYVFREECFFSFCIDAIKFEFQGKGKLANKAQAFLFLTSANIVQNVDRVKLVKSILGIINYTSNEENHGIKPT